MPENLYGSPSRDEFFNGPPAAVWEPSPHKAVAGLLELLPESGKCWPSADRDRWLAALSSVMSLLYVETEEAVKAKWEPPPSIKDFLARYGWELHRMTLHAIDADPVVTGSFNATSEARSANAETPQPEDQSVEERQPQES